MGLRKGEFFLFIINLFSPPIIIYIIHTYPFITKVLRIYSDQFSYFTPDPEDGIPSEGKHKKNQKKRKKISPPIFFYSFQI